MVGTEYRVTLSVEGAFTAWQQGATTFEQGIREMSNGLVNGARAIQEYAKVEGAEEWITDLAFQWWQDLERLPGAARRLTLTRMVVSGIPEPTRYQYTTDDGE